MLAVATPLLWSCSDNLDIDPNSPGAMTLQLISSKIDDVSRAEGDVESLIGKTYFYFYTSDSEDVEPVYQTSKELNVYAKSNVTFQLTDSEKNNIFPGENTKCWVYVVSNLPAYIETNLSEKSTISEIKKQVINSGAEFSGYSEIKSFVMDGTAEVTLDRETTTMSGSITLARAAAKILLSLRAPDQQHTSGTVYYEPILTETKINGETYIPEVYLYNTAYTGLVNGEDPNKYVFSEPLKSEYRKNFSFYGTTYYTHDAFYAYPDHWTDDIDEKDVHLTLVVPWRRTETITGSDGSTSTSVRIINFYYQVPLYEKSNVKTSEVKRNYFYNIQLKLGVIEGTMSGTVVTPDPSTISYEIADWTNDGARLNATLDRSHYLVVQDNSFEVFNENSVSFEYQSCSSVKAYVSEVKYYSTKYGQDIYLYKANYDSTTNSYEEVSEAEYKNLSSKYSAIKDDSTNSDVFTYIYDGVENGKFLSLTEVSSDDSEAVNGKITLTSDLSKIAEHFYRPITYTVVVVNDKDHAASRQAVTITQYPSKYIEFGTGDNVFVNGYYARATTGTMKNGSYGYQSYPFLYTGYTPSGDYYYNTSTSYATSKVQDFGYISDTDNQISELSAVMTSYEYLQGKKQTDLISEYTVDVHVTAFSSTDQYFSVNTSTDGTTFNSKKYQYRLGDPRMNGSFTPYDHSSSSTTSTSQYTRGYDETFLYDYYVKGVERKVTSGQGKNTQTTTNYDRYLKSWGSAAKEIKIGGTTAKYDNIIAPLYKIQSPYGALINTVYFDVAQKRCATYQEAGYPAGRWRLPTLAEVAFIVYLQSKGAIDAMFVNSSTGYWTSSGGKIYLNTSDNYYYISDYINNGISTETKTTQTGQGHNQQTTTTTVTTYPKAWVRCVYDLWYWGTDPVTPVDEYHPLPTANSTTNNVKRRR